MFLLLAVPYAAAFDEVKTIPNKDHMIVASIGEPETLDPAKCYDTGSAELIINVYNQLIFLDRERLDAYENHVATSWTVSGDGLTYKFYLRSGIKWHDYATYGTITKEDVEYTYERAMVQDYVGGPTWMYYEPLTGGYFNSRHYLGGNWSDANVIELGQMIDDAIVSGTDGGGDYLQFNLGMAYAPFPQVLAQAWGSVIDYEWSTANGAWPGSGVSFANRWGNYTWWKDHNQRYNSAVDVAFDIPSHVMMGSGPYEFDAWVVGDYWRITKFDDYWGGWPGASSAKYVSTVTEKLVEHWPTRKAMFVRGDVDLCAVPRQYIGEIEGEAGIRGVKDLPLLILSPALHYNYDVANTTQYFSEKPQLAGSEKLDLLSDIDMRTAISHTLDFATFITSAYLGEADQPATCAIKGLTFNWEELGKTPWAYDLAKAKTHFQAAWGGQAWSSGFTLQLVYNEGNVARETACTMIEYAIENLITGWGTLPTITTHGLSWGTHFIPGMIESELPVWLVGWLADYADAHNFISPYMHPYGDFAYFQNIEYGQSGHDQYDSLLDPVTSNTVAIPFGTNGTDIDNSYMMDLIGFGIEKSLYWERRAVYNEIQDIWLEEYVGIAITQPTGRHFERDWVQGWYYNSLSPGEYFRYLWKGLDADITGDDYVDISDAGKISANWHSPPFPDGPLGYDRKSDIYPIIELDGSDFEIEGADGKVNILDASLINAQWHDSAP
jgi:peptide/nickel transport system substrate-binding protein